MFFIRHKARKEKNYEKKELHVDHVLLVHISQQMDMFHAVILLN